MLHFNNKFKKVFVRKQNEKIKYKETVRQGESKVYV